MGGMAGMGGVAGVTLGPTPHILTRITPGSFTIVSTRGSNKPITQGYSHRGWPFVFLTHQGESHTMASKKNYYAVSNGRTPGIYTSWPEAQAQIRGFKGAVYKGFKTEREAKEWMESPSYGSAKGKPIKTVNEPSTPPDGKTLLIYSDGGAINNPGTGGYGVVIIDGGGRTELKGGYLLTTNNRMELMGCIKALEYVQKDTAPDRPIIITTDSKYVVDGISHGWAQDWKARGWRRSNGKDAFNPDLWDRLLGLVEGRPEVSFRWVKGHAGHLENERCDTLVNEVTRGIDKGKLDVDEAYADELLMRCS